MRRQTAPEVEVTARGLPAELWRPVLTGADDIPFSAIRGVPVTVAVPHPDDETLGAGGLLHRLAASGSAVTVVFVTDGSAGYPGCTPDQGAALAAVRRAEAAVALRVLGLPGSAAVFLDVPDGRFGMPGAAAAEAELTERLTALLTGPGGLCLAPWPDDPHPDHQAVGRAAAIAAHVSGSTLWQYPIWMRHSIRPSDPAVDTARLRVLRLTEHERAVKQAALETHASQLASPFPGYGPVLPAHVLEFFADGLEPFFVPIAGVDVSAR